MDTWWENAIWSITPTLLIGVFFYFVIRWILRADRNERRISEEIEDQERQRMGLPPREDA